MLAARMLDQSSGHRPDWNNDGAFDGHSLTEAAAGSTVMRGLLYSLMHPAARRFLSLKSPALFTNNKAAGLNREQLQAMCWSSHRSVRCVLEFIANVAMPLINCGSGASRLSQSRRTKLTAWISAAKPVGYVHVQSRCSFAVYRQADCCVCVLAA